MEQDEIIMEEVIENFKPATISRRKTKTLEELVDEENHIDRRDIVIFEALEDWNQLYSDYYLLLPVNFFPVVSAREKRKRIMELKLPRKETKTKKLIRANYVISQKLIRKKIEVIRQKYSDRKIPYSFVGFSWRYGNKESKLVLTTDIVEGYLLYKIARGIIECHDYLDEKSFNRLIRSEEFERLKQEYLIYKGREIERIGGLIAGKVPSRTRKTIHNVWIYHVPLTKGNSFINWVNLDKVCSCEAEGWHRTTYLRPNEKLFCAHSIALYWMAWEKDERRAYKRIALIPFPPPTQKLLRLYKSLRKNVFIGKKENEHTVIRPLNKIEIELLLNRAIVLNYIDLF